MEQLQTRYRTLLYGFILRRENVAEVSDNIFTEKVIKGSIPLIGID